MTLKPGPMIYMGRDIYILPTPKEWKAHLLAKAKDRPDRKKRRKL